ncbi:hypothetical protein [Cupriavidus sp. 8B]
MRKIYPKCRVLVGFTLCPGLVGPIFGGLFLVDRLIGPRDGSMDILLTLWASIAFSFVSAITAIGFYIVPFFFLSLLYTVMKLKKSWMNFAFISIAGALAALLWGDYVWHGLTREANFALGAVTSLAMAVLVLPKASLEDE